MRVINAARAATRYLSWIGLATLAALVLGACASRVDDHPTSPGSPAFLPGKVVTQQGQRGGGPLPAHLRARGGHLHPRGRAADHRGRALPPQARRRRAAGSAPRPQRAGGSCGRPSRRSSWASCSWSPRACCSRSTPSRRTRRVTVDVTGFQWQWTFDYNDQGLSFTGAGKDGPEMVVPVNETIHIRLHSDDVIHSFYVPQFFRKLDVVPGPGQRVPGERDPGRHLRRPVRRVLRPVPRRHVLHGPRRRPGHLRPVGHGRAGQGRRDARAAAQRRTRGRDRRARARPTTSPSTRRR